MSGGLATKVREKILWDLNTARCRRAVGRMPGDTLKSYIVVTPHLIHLAPLAVLNHGSRVQPVFACNGLSSSDTEWLRRIAPAVPLIPLTASLGRNPESILSHGVVIDYLAATNAGQFCIQDADCFVTESRFWDHPPLDLTKEYAVCSFVKKSGDERQDCPETFLVSLNAPLLRKYRQAYGIRSEAMKEVDPRARQLLAGAGYSDGKVLDAFKDYFDTLQQYWIVAEHEGYRFRLVPGDGDTVHHIGGTSYLYRSFENLAHWDYWPLAVHYVNLRVLEMPAARRFRQRFSQLAEFHGSADQLLEKYPDFAAGRRRAATDRILDELGAARMYSSELQQ